MRMWSRHYLRAVPDPTLRDSVRLRRSDGRPHNVETLSPEDLIEGPTELRVPVPEQDVLVLEAFGEREVPGLLGDPSRVGSAGRTGEMDPEGIEDLVSRPDTLFP